MDHDIPLLKKRNNQSKSYFDFTDNTFDKPWIERPNGLQSFHTKRTQNQ